MLAISPLFGCFGAAGAYIYMHIYVCPLMTVGRSVGWLSLLPIMQRYHLLFQQPSTIDHCRAPHQAPRAQAPRAQAPRAHQAPRAQPPRAQAPRARQTPRAQFKSARCRGLELNMAANLETQDTSCMPGLIDQTRHTWPHGSNKPPTCCSESRLVL